MFQARLATNYSSVYFTTCGTLENSHKANIHKYRVACRVAPRKYLHPFQYILSLMTVKNFVFVFHKKLKNTFVSPFFFIFKRKLEINDFMIQFYNFKLNKAK